MASTAARDSVGTLLFKEKQVRLLMALFNDGREWHISDLAKASDVTYIHTSKFVNRCESLGIIAVERHGRMKRLMLTDKGKEIVNGIVSIRSKIEPQQAKAAQEPAKEAAK